MQLREIMTAGVVTAFEGDQVLDVARLMREGRGSLGSSASTTSPSDPATWRLHSG
jgi:hypothetical protein